MRHVGLLKFLNAQLHVLSPAKSSETRWTSRSGVRARLRSLARLRHLVLCLSPGANLSKSNPQAEWPSKHKMADEIDMDEMEEIILNLNTVRFVPVHKRGAPLTLDFAMPSLCADRARSRRERKCQRTRSDGDDSQSIRRSRDRSPLSSSQRRDGASSVEPKLFCAHHVQTRRR